MKGVGQIGLLPADGGMVALDPRKTTIYPVGDTGAVGGNDDRLEEAIRAARLYYLGDLTMDAIAGRLHTSRSTVSRLLALARERGYVEFRLHDPREAAPQLEREVAARFGVRAHVVADVGGGRELETLD